MLSVLLSRLHSGRSATRPPRSRPSTYSPRRRFRPAIEPSRRSGRWAQPRDGRTGPTVGPPRPSPIWPRTTARQPVPSVPPTGRPRPRSLFIPVSRRKSSGRGGAANAATAPAPAARHGAEDSAPHASSVTGSRCNPWSARERSGATFPATCAFGYRSKKRWTATAASARASAAPRQKWIPAPKVR